MMPSLICAIAVSGYFGIPQVATIEQPPAAGYVLQYSNCCPSGMAWVKFSKKDSGKVCTPDDPQGTDES